MITGLLLPNAFYVLQTPQFWKLLKKAVLITSPISTVCSNENTGSHPENSENSSPLRTDIRVFCCFRAKLPAYGSAFAAGADLYACEGAEIPAGETVFLHTGIAIQLPAGTVGLVYARSGLAIKHGLTLPNCVGVIDSDYRGEVRVGLINLSSEPYTIAPGERIAQLCIAPVWQAAFVQTDALNDTARGAGGFGSTGKL